MNGKVPRYIQKFRIDEENRKINEYFAANEQPSAPPGFRRMPESERLQTLSELEAVRKELYKVLHQLPVTDGTRAPTLNVRIR